MHDTPLEPHQLLTKDENGEQRKFEWSYCSLVGMLNYLCNTQPKILFAIYQCACFSIDPKLCHQIAVKRIVRYLKHTENEGLILMPDLATGIKCYVDADFAGTWNTEDSANPSSVYL